MKILGNRERKLESGLIETKEKEGKRNE